MSVHVWSSVEVVVVRRDLGSVGLVRYIWSADFLMLSPMVRVSWGCFWVVGCEKDKD